MRYRGSQGLQHPCQYCLIQILQQVAVKMREMKEQELGVDNNEFYRVGGKEYMRGTHEEGEERGTHFLCCGNGNHNV